MFRALRISKHLQFGYVFGFGKDLSQYSLEEYTTIKHVMADLTGDVREGWHFTVFGDVE